MKWSSGVRFFGRHLFFVARRSRQLLRLKDREVQLDITSDFTAEEGRKQYASAVVLTIVTQHAYAIRINDFLVPVFRDDSPIRINWPLAKGENRILVEAWGMSRRKSRTLEIMGDQPVLNAPGFSRRLRIRAVEPAGPEIRMKPAPALRLKQTGNAVFMKNPVLFTPVPAIQPFGFSLASGMMDDLNDELERNNDNA